MLAKIALTFNAAIGLALALVYFNMLPYAEGIACDTARSAGLRCAEPSSTLHRAGIAVLIVTFVLTVSGLGYRIRVRRPRFGAALLCAIPVLLLGWAASVIL